jgi:hypothetical protein
MITVYVLLAHPVHNCRTVHWLILNEQYESHIRMIISFIFVYRLKPKVWVLQLFDFLFLLWFVILSCNCYDLLLLITVYQLFTFYYSLRISFDELWYVYIAVYLGGSKDEGGERTDSVS